MANKLMELSRLNFSLLEEGQKMKERFVKLKSKRGWNIATMTICRHCQQDYNDKENFNWSCRTH